MHRKVFITTLAAQGVTEASLRRVELALGPTHFDRATDRSVLASMTIVRADLDARLMEVANVMELDPVAVSYSLSHRPATVKGKWLWPDKAMLEKVGLLQGL
ncbi:MAG: hypothetical protein M1510_09265 [Nitrospirae bacterium]|nr:hypothetical protein [Nitrospirota bacterium]MCL5238474.1 hypothetical protein [Nitrospirota bacterium]